MFEEILRKKERVYSGPLMDKLMERVVLYIMEEGIKEIEDDVKDAIGI